MITVLFRPSRRQGRRKQFTSGQAQGWIQIYGRPGAVRAMGTVARGVWGYAPKEKFLILDALRSILVHVGTIFQHDKARVLTAVATANLLRCTLTHNNSSLAGHAYFACAYWGRALALFPSPPLPPRPPQCPHAEYV